jgi:cytochrome c2
MIKFSVVLAVIGLALLLFSVLPGQAATPGAQPTAPTSAAAMITPSGASEADIAYGKALFSAKGCATCHHHAAIANSGTGPGGEFPDLTAYRWNADYLRSWLKDPAAIKPNTYMPNLGLKQDEIEALIAFLSASGKG